MNLFELDRHEPIAGDVWSADVARAAIARIVADTEAAFTGEGWPIHPFDVSPERPKVLKPLYHGAAGVIWALLRLREASGAGITHDYSAAVNRLPMANAADLANDPIVAAYMGRESASFLIGELGMQMLAWRLAPSSETEERIAAELERKRGDPRGLVWGAGGSMLAALFLLERTKDSRWRDFYVADFEALWAKLAYSSKAGVRLWTTELYGETAARLGALHGYFGNAYAILRGRELLDEDRRDEVLNLIHEVFVRTAVSESGLANWPYTTDGLGADADQPCFVQFCVGAPGVVSAMCQFPNEARWPIEKLLLAGGELIWGAGPVVKMPSLCHGAPGAGYAFLKLHARTGDVLWLQRARRFAMHAINQAEAARAHYGQRKFSLWTGDLGLALFLDACIRSDAAIPTLDVF
jgi:hypothetical protein